MTTLVMKGSEADKLLVRRKIKIGLTDAADMAVRQVDVTQQIALKTVKSEQKKVTGGKNV